MKKLAAVLVFLASAFVLGACANKGGMQEGMQKGQGLEGTPQRSDIVYWCACGKGCRCNTVATKPGKCACGTEMAGGHVVFMEGNTALVCTCGPTCTCKIDPKDHNMCGCNKPVKKINLQGTGMYFCNCKGSCGCNTISDKPGTCSCGMPLHQVK